MREGLQKFWDDLDSTERLIALLGVGVFVLLLCLLQPVVPAMAVVFTGLYFLYHKEAS